MNDKINVNRVCLLTLCFAACAVVQTLQATELGFRAFCCDKTTEAGADEVYMVIVGRSNTGRTLSARLPGDQSHWDMNDGDQGRKPAAGYGGDAHCITDGVLFSDIQEGEEWQFVVLMMEEDGGTTRDYQRLASQIGQQVPNPYVQGGAAVLNVLTNLGLFGSDSDDFMGSCKIFVAKHGGALHADWDRGDDRCELSQDDPEAPGNTLRHEFRFKGDGSNYVGWFYVR
jgi:hypothetical protein